MRHDAPTGRSRAPLVALGCAVVAAAWLGGACGEPFSGGEGAAGVGGHAGGATTTASAGGWDGGTGTAAGHGPGGAGSSDGVACGTATQQLYCAPGDVCCCSTLLEWTCEPSGSCGGIAEIGCDGPEDCPAQQVCCVLQEAVNAQIIVGCSESCLADRCDDAASCPDGSYCCAILDSELYRCTSDLASSECLSWPAGEG